MSFIFDETLFMQNLYHVYNDMNIFIINFFNEFLEKKQIKILDKKLMDSDFEDTFNIIYDFDLRINHLMIVMKLMLHNDKNKLSLAIKNVTKFDCTNEKPLNFHKAEELLNKFNNTFSNNNVNIDERAIVYLETFFE
jgi:hypothetical protein